MCAGRWRARGRGRHGHPAARPPARCRCPRPVAGADWGRRRLAPTTSAREAPEHLAEAPAVLARRAPLVAQIGHSRRLGREREHVAVERRRRASRRRCRRTRAGPPRFASAKRRPGCAGERREPSLERPQLRSAPGRASLTRASSVIRGTFAPGLDDERRLACQPRRAAAASGRRRSSSSSVAAAAEPRSSEQPLEAAREVAGRDVGDRVGGSVRLEPRRERRRLAPRCRRG